MGLYSTPLSLPLAVLLSLLTAGLLWYELRRADWTRLQQPTVFSAWCASIIVLVLIWRLRIPVFPGMQLHLLGVALFALMYGRALGMLGLAVACLVYTGEYDAYWENCAANILLLAVFPCWLSDWLLKKTQQWLPHHMFIYLFGNAFFGALLVNACTGGLALAVHQWLAPVRLPADAIAYMLLLAWGEAFLVGFLATIFAVYRPAWMMTFDDELYLRGK